MKSTKVIKLAITGIGVAAMLFGCSSSGGGDNGTGGSPGTGGTSTGGIVGTGGTVSTGGTPATGGTPGTGGVATGGIVGTGGVVGTGGSTGGNGGGGHGGAGATTGGGGHGGSGTAGSNGSGGSSSGGGSSGSAFSLTSMHQADGAKFDTKYTCNGASIGAGVNPDLEWANPPAGTMSFAITFLDVTLINAGMDSLGNHWAIWNIPPTVSTFPEATKTLSGDLMNAKQSASFLAPCATSVMNNMDDQYEFTIYALSTATLNVTGGSGVAQARTALAAAMTAGQVLGTAVLHGHAGVKGK